MPLSWNRRQLDLPTETEYLENLKRTLSDGKYLTVLQRAEIWSKLDVEDGSENVDLNAQILQIAVWLDGEFNLIRELNAILPRGITLLTPTKSSKEDKNGRYIVILTKQQGDILPLQPSPDTGNYHTVFNSEDLLAAQVNENNWRFCVDVSYDEGWASCLLDLLAREVDDPKNRKEIQRLAFRRQGDAAKYFIRMPLYLLVENVKVEQAPKPIKDSSIKRFATLYQGQLRGHAVCLKVVEKEEGMIGHDNWRAKLKFLKKAIRESLPWYRLNHPNILPFLGINYDIFKKWTLIVPWMERRDLMEYVNTAKPDDEFKRNAICDVVQGLAYLHSQEPIIAHGYLCASHVLVDEDGTCRIFNFGTSSIIQEMIHSSTETDSNKVRYQPPEYGERGTESERDKCGTDVWALGCVMVEIYSGKMPSYGNETVGWKLQLLVADGHIPDIPHGVPEDIEESMLECWEQDPKERTTAEILAQKYKREAVQKLPSELWCRKGDSPEEISEWVSHEAEALKSKGVQASEEKLPVISLSPLPTTVAKTSYHDSQGAPKKAARLLRVVDVGRAKKDSPP